MTTSLLSRILLLACLLAPLQARPCSCVNAPGSDTQQIATAFHKASIVFLGICTRTRPASEAGKDIEVLDSLVGDAASNPPAALSELGWVLRQARASPPDSKTEFRCPDRLKDMEGISKAVVVAELGSPDMEESVHSRNAEPFLLMHYDMHPSRSSSENVTSAATTAESRFQSVTLKLSFSNVVLSASCSQNGQPNNAK